MLENTSAISNTNIHYCDSLEQITNILLSKESRIENSFKESSVQKALLDPQESLQYGFIFTVHIIKMQQAIRITQKTCESRWIK